MSVQILKSILLQYEGDLRSAAEGIPTGIREGFKRALVRVRAEDVLLRLRVRSGLRANGGNVNLVRDEEAASQMVSVPR